MEDINPVVVASVIALTGFVLGILNFMFRIIGLIREVGNECHQRINKIAEDVGELKGKIDK